MADIPLGTAWVDVALRFAEFEKGLKEVEKRAKGTADKIEESFMVRYTKGFTQQTAARASESSMRRQFETAQRYAKEDADNAQKRIAAEKQFQSQLKSNAAASRLAAQEDKNRLAVMLGINDALDAQVAKQVKATQMGKAGILGRIMGNMGVNANQMGMMGAQLSYGVQDFVTGLAAGNLNMALMGLSNNLGMMVMQISAAGAAWVTLGLVSIPVVIQGVKALIGAEDDAKKRAEELNKIYERRNFILGLQIKELEQLSDAEVKRMHGAEGLAKHVFGEEQSLEKINAEMDKRTSKADELKEKQKGEVVGTINVEDTKKRIKQIDDALLKNPPAGQFDALNKERSALQDDLRFLKLYNDERKKMALRGEKQTIPAIVADRFGIPGESVGVEQIAGGGIKVRRKPKPEDLAIHTKQLEEENKTIESLKAQRENIEANAKLLRKRRDEEVRREMEDADRRRKAGFNPYKQGQISLDIEEREARRQIRETAGGTILKPAMTKDERRKEIEQQYDEEMKGAAETRRFMEDEQGKKHRLIGRTRARVVAGLEEKAVAKRDAALKDLEEKGPPGAVTAEGPLLKASAAEFRRKRIELAEQFAGGKTGFAGTAELSKQIQQGLGSKGMSLPEQTNALLAGQKQATTDLINFMQNTGIKVQGGGLQ